MGSPLNSPGITGELTSSRAADRSSNRAGGTSRRDAGESRRDAETLTAEEFSAKKASCSHALGSALARVLPATQRLCIVVRMPTHPPDRQDLRFRRASADDAQAVTELVQRAYAPYVDSIGVEPGPMADDYDAVIATGRAIVAELRERVIGVLVAGPAEEGYLVENVAVHPDCAGDGVGGTLLRMAEDQARAAGSDRIYLFTHERMSRNISIYEHLGYVAYERRSRDAHTLVFMRKMLQAPQGD